MTYKQLLTKMHDGVYFTKFTIKCGQVVSIYGTYRLNGVMHECAWDEKGRAWLFFGPHQDGEPVVERVRAGVNALAVYDGHLVVRAEPMDL